MKLIDFQNSLKPGDIIHDNNYYHEYCKFIEFMKCSFQGFIYAGCEICKGYYFVEGLDNKTTYIICGSSHNDDNNSLYNKSEDFISEEEFSI